MPGFSARMVELNKRIVTEFPDPGRSPEGRRIPDAPMMQDAFRILAGMVDGFLETQIVDIRPDPTDSMIADDGLVAGETDQNPGRRCRHPECRCWNPDDSFRGTIVIFQ